LNPRHLIIDQARNRELRSQYNTAGVVRRIADLGSREARRRAEDTGPGYSFLSSATTRTVASSRRIGILVTNGSFLTAT
jgi:hypothetical protein